MADDSKNIQKQELRIPLSSISLDSVVILWRAREGPRGRVGTGPTTRGWCTHGLLLRMKLHFEGREKTTSSWLKQRKRFCLIDSRFRVPLSLLLDDLSRGCDTFSFQRENEENWLLNPPSSMSARKNTHPLPRFASIHTHARRIFPLAQRAIKLRD